jgi:hypothetical protein
MSTKHKNKPVLLSIVVNPEGNFDRTNIGNINRELGGGTPDTKLT